MLLSVRLDASATTARLEAQRVALAGQDAEVQCGEKGSEGRYLLALDEDESLDGEQAAALCRLLAELPADGGPEALELCVRCPIRDGRTTLLRRQVRVVRNQQQALTRLGRPASAADNTLRSDVSVHGSALEGSLDRFHESYRRQLEALRSELSARPDDPYLLFLAGDAELALGDTLMASRMLERALRFTPDDASWRAPVHNALARTLQEQGEHQLANQQLRASLHATSEQWQGWALLAEQHLVSLRHADVIEAAVHCLTTTRSGMHSDLIPDRATLLQQLGMAELLRHRPHDACTHLREALDLGLADDAQREVAAHYLAMAGRMAARSHD